ncbi:hypothetical protein [uncultured Paraglaciecola sp.]|uniref:hypothetical protein n=1 Tax=uncultured Paraglaciecola sp. TaxID=1765024 RepID=UPI00262073A5|nr:hypothetical protein [uncultured Paraglaciecola sp.]
MHTIIKQRLQILTLLYSARQNEQRLKPGYITESSITEALGECTFNLSVLIELKQIKQDGFKYRITGHGVEQCELQTLNKE